MLHEQDCQPGTLDGVRVLDLSRLFGGNVLTQVLGDLRAEVIKVEPSEGDTLRAGGAKASAPDRTELLSEIGITGAGLAVLTEARIVCAA